MANPRGSCKDTFLGLGSPGTVHTAQVIFETTQLWQESSLQHSLCPTSREDQTAPKPWLIGHRVSLSLQKLPHISGAQPLQDGQEDTATPGCSDGHSPSRMSSQSCAFCADLRGSLLKPFTFWTPRLSQHNSV